MTTGPRTASPEATGIPAPLRTRRPPRETRVLCEGPNVADGPVEPQSPVEVAHINQQIGRGPLGSTSLC